MSIIPCSQRLTRCIGLGENEVLDAVFDKEDASRIISGAVVIRRNYTDESNAGALVDVTEELVNIGPKNEIYLKNGQAVVMQIPSTYSTVQVGMRSLTGTPVQYKINTEEKTMNSTVDMYYKVSLAEGKLVIQNVSGGILALTKLKVTGAGTTTNDVSVETTPEASRYAMALSAASTSRSSRTSPRMRGITTTSTTSSTAASSTA